MSHHHGFVRVAAIVPPLELAEPTANAGRCLELLRQAEKLGAAVALFPELALSGYTCHDLFHQPALLAAAAAALEDLAGQAANVFSGIAVVGLPMLVGDSVFNCAAVFQNGRVIGIVPKSYLANHKEY